MIGIDEAGLGPVFGPLIVSGVSVPASADSFLRSAGIKDSKKYGAGGRAHRKRIEASSAAQKHVLNEHRVVISSDEINTSDIYTLHINAVREILIKLNWPAAGRVYIERLGMLRRNIFFSRLGFWHSGFVYEGKADEKYPAVSFASVKAKILRENIVRDMCRRMGVEYVSGYANGATEKFLWDYYRENGSLPMGIRRNWKWGPLTDILMEIKK